MRTFYALRKTSIKKGSQEVFEFETRKEVIEFVKSTGIKEQNFKVWKRTEGIWGKDGNDLSKSIYKAATK